MAKLQIDSKAFYRSVGYWSGNGSDSRNQRLGQYIVNRFFENGPCPELFYATEREFWSRVFDYVELT